MPTTTADVPLLLRAGVEQAFHEAYRRRMQELPIERFATIVSVDRPSVDFSWLGNVPMMREFTDERVIKSLRGFNYTITDRVYESTISVRRELIEDQQFNAVGVRVQDLGAVVAQHKMWLCTQVLATGTAQTAFDGVALLHSSRGNLTSSALSADTLREAIRIMMEFLGADGELLGIRPTVLMVGPKLWFAARQLLESATVAPAGGASLTTTPTLNPLQGALDLVLNPFLIGTWDDYWFVIDDSRAAKPVVLVDRSDVPVEVTVIDSANAEYYFLHDEVLIGARARYGAGAGLPQAVYAGIL